MEDFYPMPAASISAEELVDRLNKGIVRAIKTSGKSLPSSAVTSSNSSPVGVQCEWTAFTSELCCPAVEDLRQYFPPLEGNEVGTDGRPLLYAACLGLLLSERDNKEGGSGSNTPLSTFLSIASFLLDELEVDPDQPTETEGACLRPPLHLVARSCHPSAVHALLSRGADPNLADEEGWTALMACCLPDIPSYEQGGPTDKERVDSVKALLQGGDSEHGDTNVDAINYCGYSALHYASEGLNSHLIKCLLEVGEADATLRTVWGQSCLGIIMSQKNEHPEKSSECEAMILSHLEQTGQLVEARSFFDEEKKAIDLQTIIDDVLIPASKRPEADNGGGGLAAQDKRIITAIMTHLNIDPLNLFQKEKFQQFPQDDGNLYEAIHQRIMELIPSAYQQVYISNPTNEEREIITCTNYNMRKAAVTSVDGVRHIDASLIMSQSFHLHRERGHVTKQLELLTDLIVGPLQRTLSFGIPSNALLKDIIAHAPQIIEMGAGTGYWSSMLSRMGADVVAYDLDPPREMASKDLDEESTNVYFGSQSYFPVKQGDASTVFGDCNPDISGRALLMVWPNNPDAEDNMHVAVEGSILPKVWDFDCLERYHKSGGGTVIYVGEREANIELMPDATHADCGFCASRRFQTFLQEHFELEAKYGCPRWWMKEDDVTIWKRK